MPEVLSPHHLPKMFNRSRVLANQKRLQVLNGTHDTPRMPLKRRLTPSIKSRLIREHFDKNPVPHPGVADMRFDCCDFHLGFVRDNQAMQCLLRRKGGSWTPWDQKQCRLRTLAILGHAVVP